MFLRHIRESGYLVLHTVWFGIYILNYGSDVRMTNWVPANTLRE